MRLGEVAVLLPRGLLHLAEPAVQPVPNSVLHGETVADRGNAVLRVSEQLAELCALLTEVVYRKPQRRRRAAAACARLPRVDVAATETPHEPPTEGAPSWQDRRTPPAHGTAW